MSGQYTPRIPPHFADPDRQDDQARSAQRRSQYVSISDDEQTIENMRKRAPKHRCPDDHVPNDLEVPLKLQTQSDVSWKDFTLRIRWSLLLWFTTSPLFPDGQTLEFSERSQFREESVDLVCASAL